MKARAIAVVIAVLAALALVEGALRALPLPVPTTVPDETLGYVHARNLRRTIVDPESKRSIRFETNDYGFRDGDWDPAAHPSLMVVGDSFVEAMQVEKDERFTEVLAGQLSRGGTPWRVLNMGVGGTGPEIYLEWIRTFVPLFSPEYVVVAISNPSDVHNPNYDLTPASARMNYLVRDGNVVAYRDVASRWERLGWRGKVLLGQSWVLRLVKDAWVKSTTDLSYLEEVIPHYCTFAAKDVANSLLIMDTLLTQIHELTGDRLVILDLPDRNQFRDGLPEDCDRTLLETHLASFARSRGIPLVSLYDRLAGWTETPYYNGHFNPAGHRIVAAALREAIDRHRAAQTR
jgi:hypothetical protein